MLEKGNVVGVLFFQRAWFINNIILYVNIHTDNLNSYTLDNSEYNGNTNAQSRQKVKKRDKIHFVIISSKIPRIPTQFRDILHTQQTKFDETS